MVITMYKILLVEDDKNIREMVVEYFSNKGKGNFPVSVAANGEIGDIINIQTTEHVSYHHLSTSYIRGKWANSDKCHTSMLLAKCCHDLDIIMWMMSETKPKQISSFGGKFQFKPENAPKEAGTICMKDCPLVDTCVYSTKRLYIDHPDRWAFYVWDALEGKKNQQCTYGES